MPNANDNNIGPWVAAPQTVYRACVTARILEQTNMIAKFLWTTILLTLSRPRNIPFTKTRPAHVTIHWVKTARPFKAARENFRQSDARKVILIRPILHPRPTRSWGHLLHVTRRASVWASTTRACNVLSLEVGNLCSFILQASCQLKLIMAEHMSIWTLRVVKCWSKFNQCQAKHAGITTRTLWMVRV